MFKVLKEPLFKMCPNKMSLYIQSECGKKRTRKNSTLEQIFTQPTDNLLCVIKTIEPG